MCYGQLFVHRNVYGIHCLVCVEVVFTFSDKELPPPNLLVRREIWSLMTGSIKTCPMNRYRPWDEMKDIQKITDGRCTSSSPPPHAIILSIWDGGILEGNNNFEGKNCKEKFSLGSLIGKSRPSSGADCKNHQKLTNDYSWEREHIHCIQQTVPI